MNRIYRLVFNRELGLVQVASELTSSAQGGAGSAEGVRTALLPALRFAVYVALGFVTTLPAFAQAVEGEGRIISDPTAGAYRPTVMEAPNGTPVVNITTPSAQGVSRNVYSAFDVDSRGVVLNNSRTGADSQLSGPVAGNPWLARGEARVILNEVNSADPSRLAGYVEVAGRRAEVIIANPAGITCAGCGFINASNATLTTGKPVFVGGNLDHYRVEGGTVRIEGAGLDATTTDYTRILARAMELHGGVWAPQIDVQLGANTVNATDPAQVTPIAGQGPAPQFALDVGALGGMYGNKIFLVSNERGLGVRNAGQLGAQAGGLVVTVDGRLENVSGGTLQSQQDARISASGGVSNSGTISAGRELVVSTPADVDNRGGQLNARRLDVSAASLQNAGGAIEQTGMQALALTAGTLSNRDGGRIGVADPLAGGGDGSTGGSSSGGGDPISGGGSGGQDGGGSTGGGTLPLPEPLADGALNIAGTLSNDAGKINAGGGVALNTANGLDNSGGQLGLRSLTMTQGDLVNAAGTLDITGAATLHTTSINNTAGALNVGGALDVRTQIFHNAGGTLSHSGPTAKVQVDGTLDNAAGTIASNAAAMTLGAGVLVNEDGLIEHAGADGLNVQAGTLHGAGGAIVTNGSATVRAGTVDHRGAQLSAAQLDIAADAFDNRSGQITATGLNANTLRVRDTLDNGDGGAIGSQGDLSLQAGTFRNAAGTVQHAGTGTLSIDAATLSGANGTLGSNGTMRITGITTDLRGGTTFAQAIGIDTGTLVTAGGTLTALGTDALTLKAQTLDNSAGAIATNGALDITTSTLINRDGSMTAVGSDASQVTASTAFDNTGGTLATAGATTVQAGELTNVGGVIQTAGEASLAVGVDGRLDNSAEGLITSGGDLVVSADVLDNSGGAIQHAGTGALAVDAVTLNGAGGQIASNGALSITGTTTDLRNGSTFAQSVAIDTTDLTTAGGTLTAAGTGPTTVTARGTWDNTAGTVHTNGALTANAGALRNAGGTILAAGTDATQVRVTNAFDNAGGTFAAAGATTVHAGELLNTGGTVQVAGSSALSVTTDGRLVNDSGTIEGNDAIDLAAQSLSNLGGMVQTQDAITANVTDVLDNSGGTIASGDVLDVSAGTLRNRDTFDPNNTDAAAQKGLFGKQVTAAAGTLDNTRGQIQASEALTLTGGNLINASGALGGTGVVTVNATTFDNAGGSLIQRGESGTLTVAATQMLANTAGGLIGAEGTVNVRGGTRLDNSGGTIFAKHGLTIGSDGDVLNRSGGLLQSNGDLTVSAGGSFDNTDGVFDATGRGSLTAATRIDNTRGQVLAGGVTDESALTVSTSTLINQGGTLGSRNGDAVITADKIDNRFDGLLVTKRDLMLNTGVVNNAGGTVYAGNDLRYETAGATMDNTGGKFGSGATTWLNLAGLVNAANGQIQASTLWLTLPTLDTTGGEIAADVLHANVGTLTGTGRLFGGQGLSLAFNGDFTYGNGLRLESDGTLSLTVTGTFTNQGTWQTASVLNITAGNVINEGTLNASNASGGGKTTVTANGTIDNRTGATIEGDEVTLTATNVTNTGDIVGDRVTIDADTLTNGRDLGTGQPARAYGEGFIGASENLDLRIGSSLRNLDAEIFSLGDLSITGRGGAGTRVGAVDNLSGRIQAEGDLLLATNALRNERRVLNFVQRPLTPEEQAALTLETAGEDALTYNEGIGSVNERLCGQANNPCTHFRVDQYIERATPTEGLFVDTATATPAAQLLSGGDMTLEAGSVRNRFATIAARANLTINGQGQTGSSGESAAGVSNESVSGQQTYQVTAEYAVGYQTCPTNVPYTCEYEDYGDGGTLNFGTVTRTYSPEEGRATISAGNALTIITDGDVNNAVVSAADPRSGISVTDQAGPGSTGLTGANGRNVKTSGALQLALNDFVNGSDNPANAAPQVIGSPDRPLPGLVPPDNGMYDTSRDPNAPFLVTTAPRFASKGNWTSSNYLLGLLGAQDTHKRLGDGYYEQMLVMDQILQLTGRRNLGGGLDGLAQYQRLMDGAAAEAARLGLALGAPLTSTQIASLSQDITWLVEMEVDGQRVLVPVVYLSSATAERLRNDGALMAGDTVDIQTPTKITNDGTIVGNRGTWLSADSLINNGAIRADNGRLDILTRTDTTNFGRMSGHSVVIEAGGSILNQPTFDGLAWRGGAIEAGKGGLQMVASLDVTNRGTIASAGNAVIGAGRDAVFAGKSSTSAGGYLFIDAGRNVVSETVTDTTTRSKSIAYGRQTTVDETVTGATFTAGDQLAMVSRTGDIDLTAANVRSENGGVALVAEQGDVNLRAAEEEHHLVEDTYRKKKGTFGSTTTKTHLEVHDTVSVGTTVSGKTVDVLANNILVHGSTVVSDEDTSLVGRNNVSVVAAENTHDESFSSSKKKSGMFSDGGVGFTVGSSKMQQTADVHQVTHTGSVIGAVDGEVNIYAGNHYQQTGSDVIGMDGVSISGKTVTIEHAVDTLDVHETQKAKSSGLHVSIKGGAADAAAQAYGQLKRGSEVEDDRLKGLYAAQAAQTLFSPSAGGPQAFGDAADMMKNGGPSKDNNGGMSLRIGIGASSSKAETDIHQTTAHGSTVSSRGNTTVVAREGSLAVVGSTVEGVNTALAAADKLILISAEEASALREKSKASSGEIGVTIGSEAGIGVYVSASASKGKGQGDGTSHAETIIRGGETTTFVSGGDTIGRGAQIIGEKVTGRVGGDFLLSSDQDENNYDRKDQSAGIDAAVGIGGGSVSASYSQSKIDSNYTSVQKQTGIQAGKGGVDLYVEGHMQLDGAAIASAADPSKNRIDVGSLGWSDLKNKADYKAESISVSGGGGSSGGSFSGGYSNTSDSSSSTTKAGIADGTLVVRDGSGGDIARGVTELQQTGLKEIYDAQKVAETMELQQVAGQVGFTAAKDVISYKRDAAQNELNAAAKDYENATTDEARAAALARKDAAKASMDRWSDGGSAKVGTQVLAGVFQASLGGTDLVGAASGVAANEYLLTALSNKANNAGLDADGTGHEAGMSLAAIAVGWAAGAVTGNGTSGAIAGNAAQQHGYYDYRDGRAQTLASQEQMLAEMANGDPATFEAMKYLLNEAMKQGADPADLAMSLSTPGVAANLVGMAVVESTAQGEYGKNFNALTEAEKRAVLEKAGSARVNVGPSETVEVGGVAAQPGTPSSTQGSAQPQEESFQTKAGRAVSGVIEEGGRGVEKAVDWVGEDNATALAYVAMAAFGGPVKTLGSALWENSPAGQAVQTYKQEYLVNPLSRVIGTYGLGAETDAQRQAVQPASDTMANMGVDTLLSSFGAISAGKGAKNIVEGSEGFGKKVDAATAAPTDSLGAASANAQDALNRKLAGLEKAQANAATTRTLPDGRVRYYTQEVPARTDGPTRGASFVTEHDPKSGQVRQWMESYDQSGRVIRVHPKSINGQPVNAQHYPPTGAELESWK